jgi:hypothetical protein
MKFFLKCIKSIILILFNYHTYKTNIFKNKASDIIFILGSGSSINNFKFWNCVKKKDSIGFNFFLFHKFIPNFYIFETPNINNNNQFKSQLELIDYKLSKNAGYKKVQFFLKIRPGYSQISKIFKKNKINFSTILDFNFNLKKKKFIKFIRNKFFFLFNYFFLCGHGVGTLEKICLKAFFSGYKSIVLCGVDLNNTNYFFYKKKIINKNLHKYIDYIKEFNFRDSRPWLHRTADPKFCRGDIVVQDVLLIYQKYLFKDKCKIYVTSKKSLLHKYFPLYNNKVK